MIDEADAVVYEKYADELIRFATMLAGPSVAEDLVADTMLRVFSSPGWKQVASPRAYLYRSVMREAVSAARSSRRRAARERRVGLWASDCSPAVVRPELVDAMRSLSVRQRAVVFMSFWLDAPTDEIADHLSLSVRTVQRELEASLRQMERHLHD
jgi:DNA-directed RNA polymerase specialized sigma24 family protein